MKTKTLFFNVVPTRLGSVYIACTDLGLAALQIGGSAASWERRLKKKYSIAARKNRTAMRKTAVQLREYLAGKRRSFRGRIDWRGMSAFQRGVLRAALRISYGRVTTYGAIAARLGNPRGARAVGRALGANPIPLVIPCHRVIGGNGALGGYSAAGGVGVKRKLLCMEGALGRVRPGKTSE